MDNLIIIVIIGIIIGLASAYIYKARKKGQKCIGCPHSCNCSASDKAKCCGCEDPSRE